MVQISGPSHNFASVWKERLNNFLFCVKIILQPLFLDKQCFILKRMLFSNIIRDACASMWKDQEQGHLLVRLCVSSATRGMHIVYIYIFLSNRPWPWSARGGNKVVLIVLVRVLNVSICVDLCARSGCMCCMCVCVPIGKACSALLPAGHEGKELWQPHIYLLDVLP